MELEVDDMKIEKYSEYTYTNIKWLGRLPKHWKAEKGKWLFVKMERPVRPDDDIVTCFRDGQVTLRINRKTEGFTNALKEHGYQGIRKGDLVIHNMDAFAGAIGVSDSDGKSTPVYSACMPRFNNVNQYYYAYFLRDLAKSGFIESLAKGIRERSTDFRFIDFGVLDLPLPPKEEQTAIAQFLDRKTAQIDKAIAQKEKLIELLKERRQILIHKAVTRGLNPNVKLKPSGVEWIGEIPEHWEVKRLKFLATYFKGNAFSSADFNSEGIPIVKASNIKKWAIENITSFIALENQKRGFESFRLNQGDIIISTVGSKPEIKESAVGQLAIVNEEYDGSYLNQNTVCIRPIKEAIDKFYLKCVFTSNYLRNNFDSISLWIANQAYIEIDSILQIAITIPPKEEQKLIAEYIEVSADKIVTTISLKEQEIEKLKEYKATLINSAVTGKIKVC